VPVFVPAASGKEFFKANYSGTVLIYSNLSILLFIINKKFMGNLLYLIAVILVIAWAIGYFGYQAGGIIHILLVIAIIAVLLRVIRRA